MVDAVLSCYYHYHVTPWIAKEWDTDTVVKMAGISCLWNPNIPVTVWVASKTNEHSLWFRYTIPDFVAKKGYSVYSCFTRFAASASPCLLRHVNLLMLCQHSAMRRQSWSKYRLASNKVEFYHLLSPKWVYCLTVTMIRLCIASSSRWSETGSLIQQLKSCFIREPLITGYHEIKFFRQNNETLCHTSSCLSSSTVAYSFDQCYGRI